MERQHDTPTTARILVSLFSNRFLEGESVDVFVNFSMVSRDASEANLSR